MYTSYYSSPKIRRIPKNNLVSISIYPPPWLKKYIDEGVIKWDKRLAPTPYMLKKGYTRQEFFDNVLALLDPHEIYEQYKGSVLLCYEKDPTQCHRRWVAEWLEESLGVKVPEL